MSTPKRILIIDDHPLYRDGLKARLGVRPDFSVVGEAGTCAEGLRLAQNLSPDLAVIDISLPDGSGLAFLEHVQHERPGLPVIVLSMHHEAEYAQRCLSLGARGYLSKNSAPEELEEAMTSVLDGGIYVSPSLLDSSGPAGAFDSLSRQERDVARRLGQGETITGIAQALGVSVTTASTYRTRAMRKLGITTTSGLIRYLLERGLPGL